jgi:hypothetical protein
MADDWFPPTEANPLPVNVLATPPPNVEGWFPPSGTAPLPVYIVGNTGLIGDPPDNQLYGRRGPPGSGVWALISLAAGPPEAPTTGAIFGRGQVAGAQVWTPVLPLAGGTMTGPITLAADPAAAFQPATKQYVDNVGAVANAAVRRSGDAMTGFLSLAGAPSSPLHAATKQYVDNVGVTASGAVQRAGDTMTGLLVLSANPTNPLGAATKQYVDAVGTVANAAVPLAGGTMTGLLVLSANPTANLGAVTKQYADAINTTASAAVRRAGDTMTGALILNADPTAARGAVTKQYADTIMAIAEDSVALSGDTMTGLLILSADPAANLGAATKQYVDALRSFAAGAYLPLTGGTMTGPLGIGAGAAALTINRNSAALPPALPPTALWLNGADGEQPDLLFDTHGGAPVIFLRRANGTGAAPARVNAGDIVGNFTWRGYGATGYTNPVGRLQLTALENFTDTAYGSQLNIGTAAVGGTLVSTQVAIGPGLSVGPTTTPPAGGMLIGDLNALRVLIAGVAVPGEAPTDGQAYGRRSAAWAAVIPAAGGTISGTAPGSLAINPNTLGSIVNPIAGANLILQQVDGGVGALLQMNSFGAGANVIVANSASGTAASPGAVAGQNLFNINARGFDGSTWSFNAARIIMAPITNPWTTGDHSTQIMFLTTPVGSVAAAVTQAVVGPGLTVGAPTAAPAGGMLVGDVNAQRVFAQGVPLLSTAGGTMTGGLILGTPAGAAPAAGGLVMNGLLQVNLSAAAAPTPMLPSTGVQVIGADGVNTAIEVLATGVGNPNFVGRRSGGTVAAPAPVPDGAGMGVIQVRGYGATAWSPARGVVSIAAAETWTDTAQGTQFSVNTTATGTTTTATNLTLDGLGNLTILGGTAIKAGGGSWTAPSSLAVKCRVENYTRGLAELRQLQPISFEYNGEMGTIADGRRYVGLAAEAVMPLMPEMLTATVLRQYHTSDDGDADIVDHPSVLLDPSALTYALINAVFELEQRLDGLDHGMLEHEMLEHGRTS